MKMLPAHMALENFPKLSTISTLEDLALIEMELLHQLIKTDNRRNIEHFVVLV